MIKSIHQTNSNQIDNFDRVGTDSFTAPSPNTLYRYPIKNDFKNFNANVDNHFQEQPAIIEKVEQSDIEEKEKSNFTSNSLLLSVLNGDCSIDKVNIDELPDLMQELKEHRDYNILHHNIDDAERTNQILFTARQHYNKKMKDASIKVRLENLEQRIADAKDNLRIIKRNFLLEQASLEETHKNQINDLGQRQVLETKQFRNSWNSAKFQRMYNKPSQELRTLYMQSSLLQHSKDRQLEQRKAEQQFRTLCQSEKTEKSRLMNIEYQNALKKLERKQKNDLNILLQKQNAKMEELGLREAREIKGWQLRLKNLFKEKEHLTNLLKPNLSQNNRFQETKNISSGNNQMSQTKPDLANFVKLTLPPLSSTSPRRMRLKTPRFGSTS